MLLLNANKISAGTIGSYYCEGESNPGSCRTDVTGRLNFFNDRDFLRSFLPYLRQSQFFVFTKTVVEIDQDSSKIILDGYDIINGKRKTISFYVPYDQVGMNNALKELNEGRNYTYTQIRKAGNYFIIRLDGKGNDYPLKVKSFKPKVIRITPKPPVIIPDPLVGPTGEYDPNAMAGIFSETNIKNLLIPALLVAGAYFLLN